MTHAYYSSEDEKIKNATRSVSVHGAMRVYRLFGRLLRYYFRFLLFSSTIGWWICPTTNPIPLRTTRNDYRRTPERIRGERGLWFDRFWPPRESQNLTVPEFQMPPKPPQVREIRSRNKRGAETAAKRIVKRGRVGPSAGPYVYVYLFTRIVVAFRCGRPRS